MSLRAEEAVPRQTVLKTVTTHTGKCRLNDDATGVTNRTATSRKAHLGLEDGSGKLCIPGSKHNSQAVHYCLHSPVEKGGLWSPELSESPFVYLLGLNGMFNSEEIVKQQETQRKLRSRPEKGIS